MKPRIVGAGTKLSRIFYLIVIVFLGALVVISRSSVWQATRDGDVESLLSPVESLVVHGSSDRSVHTAPGDRATMSEDIRLNMERMGVYHLPEFLPNYKNPCWRESLDVVDPYPTENGNMLARFARKPRLLQLFSERLQNGTGWRMRCLPYFYLAGLEKCGTTDMTNMIMEHPDAVSGGIHVPHWWSRLRSRSGVILGNHTVQQAQLHDYVDLFDGAAEAIRLTEHDNYHHMITGEGSASTLDENIRWQLLPGNAELKEPKYLNAHMIHAITPTAKIIVSMRNPTSRLYSAYLFYNDSRNKSSSQFHDIAVGAVTVLERCIQTNGPRHCVYNPPRTPLSGLFMVNVHTGIYHAYIKDWLEVFPRRQMHFVYFEDYANDRIPVLNEIFKFLEVGPLPDDIAPVMQKKVVSNARRSYSSNVGPMLNKTKLLLDNFYAEHNQMLADLLKDQRFLWKGQ